MLGLVILCVFAAFGVLCVLWVLLGCLLPRYCGTAMVCACHGEDPDGLIRRHRWLRDLGLIHCPLILVDCGMTEQQKHLLEGRHGIEICTPEELSQRVG